MPEKTVESEARWSVADPREVLALGSDHDLEPVLNDIEVIDEAAER
ncbi:MAG: hypothetical protein AAF658_06745 [Myxococcota bacterium]